MADGGMVWEYEGVHFMFTQRTWHWSARKYPKSNGPPCASHPSVAAFTNFSARPQRVGLWGGREPHMFAPGIIDIGLAVSRDGGRTFKHLGEREPFVTVGPAGGFASKMVWALPSPAIVGDQICECSHPVMTVHRCALTVWLWGQGCSTPARTSTTTATPTPSARPAACSPASTSPRCVVRRRCFLSRVDRAGVSLTGRVKMLQWTG